MADECEDHEATFQFIEEAQNCPDLWDVSSAAYKDTKNKHVVCQGWDFYSYTVSVNEYMKDCIL